jgi:hypothetical protein
LQSESTNVADHVAKSLARRYAIAVKNAEKDNAPKKDGHAGRRRSGRRRLSRRLHGDALIKAPGPFDRVPGACTVPALSDNGENMDSDEVLNPADHPGSVDSYRELQSELKSLRSLVCDLLKANQELRVALLEAGIDDSPSTKTRS